MAWKTNMNFQVVEDDREVYSSSVLQKGPVASKDALW